MRAILPEEMARATPCVLLTKKLLMSPDLQIRLDEFEVEEDDDWEEEEERESCT